MSGEGRERHLRDPRADQSWKSMDLAIAYFQNNAVSFSGSEILSNSTQIRTLAFET
jgi:hypothetical protein